MTTKGYPRRELLRSLVPPGSHVIDVGADHGRISASIPGAIATERMPHRRSGPHTQWVVADGLAPFRTVDVAIIAGMGTNKIIDILTRGPVPRVAILHAPDTPRALRLWLAGHGWRIDAEGLAPEGGRFAEVIRAIPGEETAAGLELEFGPKLLTTPSPHLAPHLEGLATYFRALAARLRDHVPDAAAAAEARATFAENHLPTARALSNSSPFEP